MKDRKQIVIIEDDAVLRRGLSRFFANEGFRSFDFENGEEAFLSVSKKKPDLIFCDFKLPGANGFEIFQKMREAGIDSPFILMTAYFSDELKNKALAKGVFAVIEKPFELNELKKFCLQVFSASDLVNAG